MSLKCSECERDLRSGHDKTCSRYRALQCKCGHSLEQHDEEGMCLAADCPCTDFKTGRRKGKP